MKYLCAKYQTLKTIATITSPTTSIFLTPRFDCTLYYSANETSETSYSYNYIIYDGYMYVGSNDADAKHPMRRLKLTKR